MHKSIFWLFEKFIKPYSADEDVRRREFILNIILVSSLFLLLILDISVLYNSVRMGVDYKGISFFGFSLILFAFGTLLGLSRKGWPALASYTLLAIYFLGVSYSGYHWGIELPIVLLSYGLVIIIASILISTKFGFLLTGLSMCVILTLGFLEVRHLISPRLYWKTDTLQLNNAFEFSAILFLTMVISWLSNREIEKSLYRARSSEEALRAERDLLEIKVEQRTQELKQLQVDRISQLYRFSEFGRLASGLFHDLINPLTSLSLHVEKLAQGSDARAAETKQYLEQAMHLTKRMEAFMQGVSKQIQNRELDLLFSLSEEIEQSMQILAYKARKASVEIIYYQPGLPVITFGNPLKFHQVITNLVSNAIDAYDNLKSIENDRKKIVIKLIQEAEQISLTISDNGSGIQKKLLDKIFEPFFTTKDPHKGTGIGLSTTKDIVEKHFSGKIYVASSPERGTTFTILLPSRPSPEGQPDN